MAKERQKWQAEFWQSEEGRARARATRSFPLNIQADGSFTIEDVSSRRLSIERSTPRCPFRSHHFQPLRAPSDPFKKKL